MNGPDGAPASSQVARYGLILSGDERPGWLDQMAAADRAGFWGLGVGDSQSIYPDVYVRLALASTVTSRAQIGTWVTNPLTRHPAVTAGAIASIDRLSSGRSFLGIGTGDSAAKNIGLAPATLDELEDYVRALNELLTAGRTQWHGATCTARVHERRVPIWMAVSGPRATRLAGRIADGVVIGSGLTTEIVAQSLAELRRGAEAAGRDGDDIDVWWLALANLADDDETAVQELKGSFATFGHMATKSRAQRKLLGPDIQPAMERLHAKYNAMQHGAHGATDNSRLTDELDLTDYLRGRFAICGSPETFLKSVKQAQDAGALNLWFAARAPAKDRFLRLWAEHVQPLL